VEEAEDGPMAEEPWLGEWYCCGGCWCWLWWDGLPSGSGLVMEVAVTPTTVLRLSGHRASPTWDRGSGTDWSQDSLCMDGGRVRGRDRVRESEREGARDVERAVERERGRER